MNNKLLYPSLLALLICGCSQNDTVEDTSANNTCKVSFKGNVNVEQVSTKASVFPQSSTASIFAYSKDALVDDNTVNIPTGSWFSNYEATGIAGDLTVASPSTGIYLPGGLDYDFYACSPSGLAFTSVETPASSGTYKKMSGELQNGVDYLWAKVAGKAVASGTTTDVALTFDHSAAKLKFTIQADAAAGITSVAIDQATDASTITPTDPTGSFMYLSSGIIDPLQAVSATPINLVAASVANTLEYIMLPLTPLDGASAANKITLSFKVKINGETSFRTYTATLDVPQITATDLVGGYQAKYVYNYTVTIKANGITFSAAQVNDWEPSEQADPIVPTE